MCCFHTTLSKHWKWHLIVLDIIIPFLCFHWLPRLVRQWRGFKVCYTNATSNVVMSFDEQKQTLTSTYFKTCHVIRTCLVCIKWNLNYSNFAYPNAQLSEHFASVLVYMHTLISNFNFQTLDYLNVFSWSRLVRIIEVALNIRNNKRSRLFKWKPTTTRRLYNCYLDYVNQNVNTFLQYEGSTTITTRVTQNWCA